MPLTSGVSWRPKTLTKVVAAAATIGLCATVGLVCDQVTAAPATAATSTLLTGTSAQQVASVTNGKVFASGSASAVVASAASPLQDAQAASLAAALGEPLVVAPSSTDSATVISDLSKLGATSVMLVGSTTSFTTQFQADIAASATVDSSLLIDSNLARSTGIVAASKVTHFVVAESDQPADMRVATNYAVTEGLPLVVVDGTESDADLTSFFTPYAGQPVTLVGAAIAVAPDMSEDQTPNFDNVGTADPIAAESAMVQREIAFGNTANDIEVAPNDQLASIAEAALYAHTTRGIALTAGPLATITANSAATQYVKLWGSETANLRLVGQNTTSAQLTSLAAPSLTARKAVPAFRTTGTTLGTGTWTITYTALTGSTSYKVFDISGTQLATSTTTSATMKGAVQAVAVVGFNAKGTEVGRFDYQINQYAAAADKETAVIASTKGGAEYVQFLGALKTPRLITRTTINEFDSTSVPVTAQVAITCLPYYVDSGMDQTKEYQYNVTTLGGADNRACNSAASQNPTATASTNGAGVALPPTSFPATAAAKSLAKDAAAPATAQTSYAATPTLTELGVMAATGMSTPRSKAVLLSATPKMRAEAAAAAATTGPDYTIRYQGFIKENYVYFPGATGDSSHKFFAFAGNNRSPGQAGGDFKFRADVKFTFQGNVQSVTMKPAIGTTHKFKCKFNFVDCIEVAHATASTDGVTLQSATIKGSSAVAQVNVHTAIPLVSGAPAIDGNLTFRIAPGHSTIQGHHDAMPIHEVFSAPLYPQSDIIYATDYISSRYWLPCLFGDIIPSCQINVNQAL